MVYEEIKVGSEVDSHCTKCKLLTNHRVVAMVDGAVKRVICLTCEGQHNYRPPAGEKKKAATAKRIKKTEKRSRTESPRSYQQWLDWKAGITEETTIRPYNMKESFGAGEIVEHSKFGLGFVMKVLSGNKIEIMFEKEIKTLAINYTP